MKTRQDRNFDSLVDKFEQQVYDSVKGNWRLKLLKEDLETLYLSNNPLQIWDAGCGFAQISFWLAEKGHDLTLCDVSEKMLNRAKQGFTDAGLSGQFYLARAQNLAAKLPQFDLVLFHAVLEWLAEPLPSLRTIVGRVKSGGYISLLFYNRNTMVYRNILKGDWRWRNVLDDAYIGKGKRLTPPHPQYPHEVTEMLSQCGFSVTQQTGIRVFHDYLSTETIETGNMSELFELEYRYCRMPTYRDMGRYIHLLARRDET